LKIVCGKCSAEVELPRSGESSEVRCPACGAVFRMPSLAEGEELPHPESFPGYRVVAIVGYGGMGTVYRAIQLSMDREVAVKVLLRKHAHVPRFVARFEREASALAVLNHPNIVAVIDRGRVDDLYYFVMEYVHGRTVRYLIKNDLLSVERCLDIAIQICQALDAAHACGVVHRDIKPSNILVREGGIVKVADFGIVHMIEQDDATERERRSRLGTARYMAPEQRGTGEIIDARADVFALGVTLFEMLTRTLPKGTPASELNPLVPREVDRIIERATQADREQRFQSASEMAAALGSARDSMQLEETSATSVLPAVAPPTLACPACGEAVEADVLSCGACGAAVGEGCYRADCEGVHRLGSERCARCGGHLGLLREQRRAELEAALERGEALAAEGRLGGALRELEGVAADRHRAFDDLHERAGAAIREVRARRRSRRLRSLGLVAAVLTLFASAGAAYWAVGHGLFGRPEVVEGKKAGQPASREVVDVAPATKLAVAPRPAAVGRRDAFVDYLLALTDGPWAAHPPAVRLWAACDASLCVGAGRSDGEAGAELANTLAAIGRGEGPAAGREILTSRLADALDALCRRLLRQMRRERPAGKSVARLEARYREGWDAAGAAPEKLELAASTLFHLMAGVAAHQPDGLDLPARLLLLDASLTPRAGDDGLRRAGDQVVRAGRLLVRLAGNGSGGLASPELLEDARVRLRRAEREAEPVLCLADGLEALVEAVAARAPLRAAR